MQRIFPVSLKKFLGNKELKKISLFSIHWKWAFYFFHPAYFSRPTKYFVPTSIFLILSIRKSLTILNFRMWKKLTFCSILIFILNYLFVYLVVYYENLRCFKFRVWNVLIFVSFIIIVMDVWHLLNIKLNNSCTVKQQVHFVKQYFKGQRFSKILEDMRKKRHNTEGLLVVVRFRFYSFWEIEIFGKWRVIQMWFMF